MTGKRKSIRRTLIDSVVLIIFCIFSSRFYATLWILILPIGFFVVLLFSITGIKNVLFWIRNKTTIGHPWLPLLIQAFAIWVAFLILSPDKSKQYYLRTVTLADNKKNGCPCNLYIEYYSVFQQGAFGTGLNSEYLTDSLNFRKFLGVYDEGGERINMECKGDKIIVRKTSSEFIDFMWSGPKILETKIYSLAFLKKQRAFE